jgi:5-methylcytosine-specific restriction enzyme subunit McrC
VTIPIRNLYYLFLYAWAKFPDGAVGGVGVDESPDIPNLFADLLSSGTRRLFRRGLDRGYEVFTDELISPRGRLRLDRMIKETTLLRGTTVCDFDELTHDVLHNQILKATLTSLANCSDLEKKFRHDLKLLARRFHHVKDIQLSSDCFRKVVVSRNNRQYILLMRTCEFVFRTLMPDEGGASSRFQDVLSDEKRMSAVFEDFLRNFFKLHRTEYRVRSESQEWYLSEASKEDLALLPGMKTDITLRHSNHTIIIDAKFHKKALVRSQYGEQERVQSQHLYQMAAYLKNEHMRQADKGLSGMLLYPDVGRSLRLQYQLLGIPVLVATVDLGQEWRDIEAELLDLLGICASAAGIPREPVGLDHIDTLVTQ